MNKITEIFFPWFFTFLHNINIPTQKAVILCCWQPPQGCKPEAFKTYWFVMGTLWIFKIPEGDFVRTPWYLCDLVLCLDENLHYLLPAFTQATGYQSTEVTAGHVPHFLFCSLCLVVKAQNTQFLDNIFWSTLTTKNNLREFYNLELYMKPMFLCCFIIMVTYNGVSF